MLFQIKFGIVANLEYPDIATLVTPLFGFAEKRGFLFLGLFTLFTPQAKRGWSSEA